MKKSLIVLILLLTVTSLITAQSEVVSKAKENNAKISYKIDARPFLEKSERQVTEFLKKNPDYFNKLKLKKSTAWNFSIGSTKEWFASNLQTNSFYKVPSTCRAIGTHCYIFVEDAIWNSRVSQSNVDAIKNEFDNSTPADPNKGIYQTDVDSFGDPPDVDNDPKIIILILDIKDGYNGSGGFVAGYFHSVNEVAGTNSNMAEIYYLDADPVNLSTASGLNDAMSTTAHEFQHMIHFNYHNGTAGKPVQTTFLNEGCSTTAEVLCGYPIYPQNLFNNDFNEYLLTWRTGNAVLNDYSRAARFTTYMYEQFGIDYLRKFVQSSLVGIAGINDALSKLTNPTSLRFKGAIENWLMANILNDKSINSAWGYTTPNVNNVNALNLLNPNYTSPTINVEKAAADYVTFSHGKNLSIQFNDSGNGKLKFKVIKYNNNNTVEIDSLNPNTPYNYSNFGTTFNKITFAILNPETSSAFPYSYTATGQASSIELAYDENEPTGVLPLSNNDTVCVVFDGVSGGTLDSIRVALRQAGSVHGGIYEYTGTLRPTPLGNVLVPNLTVTSNIAQKPPYPYPVPWPNWITVDLTSANIDASNSFVAAFVVEGTYPQQNRIMVTEQPNVNNHSFTYLNQPSSGNPDWYFLTNSGDSVFTYLIRAYVGFKVTGVEETTELPKNFEVKQNYPNPFNPSTKIQYSLPNTANVKVKVYDLLGNLVRTFTNDNQTAGIHEINFDGTNLASGIYIYRIQAISNKSGQLFEQSRKMLLIK